MDRYEFKTMQDDMDKIIDRYIDLVHARNSAWNSIPSHYYTDYNVKKGLRNADGTGVLAGFTSVGEVHGYVMDEGNKSPVPGKLRYRGISIEDIVDACTKERRFGFEETAFLLLFGFLPDKELLDDFTQLLARKRSLPGDFTEDMIFKAPSKNIMNKLGRSVLALYSYDDNPDDISIPNLLRQSIDLIARFPVLVADAYSCKRHYFDGESLVLHNPSTELSAAENFLYMIRPDKQFTREEAEALDLAMILQAEHGGGNNSAFTVRVLSSSGTDTYSAISASVGSLKGPKHGGANDKMLSQMDEIMANVSNWEDDNEVADYLRKILHKEAGDGKGLIYGIGHAVYTISDPRAVILKKRAEQLAESTGYQKEFELYSRVERLAPDVFREFKGIDQEMCANVDFYSGFVYRMLKLPQELYTPIFAMSRIVGWSAHRIEEIMTNKKIIRPAYKSAVKRLGYTPIDEREKIEL